tara:strand:+ start:2824 stop:3474 length:651 start_codon:yes stop_codon:yes gene_type:complete
MSTIGTTLKEPRVFAHDAIALKDLTGYPPTPAATFTIIDGGTDYTPGVLGTTTLDGGKFANVNVVSVAVGGIVTGVNLAGGDGGMNYTVGDRLRVSGGDFNCILEVATVAATGTWALGDPITAPEPTFNTVPYWNEKMSYTYTTTPLQVPANSGTFHTPGPGAALYVGADMDISVVTEAGNVVEYTGVASGSFLPVSVLSVTAKSTAGLDDVLALF